MERKSHQKIKSIGFSYSLAMKRTMQRKNKNQERILALKITPRNFHIRKRRKPRHFQKRFLLERKSKVLASGLMWKNGDGRAA